jgi:hypothetical protein
MSKTQYQDIPVVLVVAGNKIDYIPHVVKNLSEHCNFGLFYVICPSRDLDRARSHSKSIDAEVVVVDEDDVIPGLNLNEVRRHLKLSLPDWPENHLPGWYFQQFLKMGFSLYAPHHANYLIWDSDTLLIRPVDFFDGDKILLTQGNEYHKEYFNTIQVLLGDARLQSVSHISQHLMVRTRDMYELINALQLHGNIWWQNILKSLSGKTPFQFSEYEIYANYCLSTHPSSYKSIKRTWFRYGRSYFGCDLPDASSVELSKIYDFVAFEDWDSGPLKFLRAHMIVLMRRMHFRSKSFI